MNVWTTHRIVRIDPATGSVDASLDLSDLAREAAALGMGADGVANGIASTPEGHLWVTGKGRPLVFLVDPALPE